MTQQNKIEEGRRHTIVLAIGGLMVKVYEWQRKNALPFVAPAPGVKIGKGKIRAKNFDGRKFSLTLILFRSLQQGNNYDPAYAKIGLIV